MSRFLCCALVACFALTASFDAEARRRDQPSSQGAGLRPPGGPLGLGLSLGSPTGLAGKYYLTHDQGLSFGLGFGGYGYLGAHLDYVWAPTSLINIPPGTLYPYIGGGAFLGVGLYRNPWWTPYWAGLPLGLGVELPLGLAWNFAALPLDLFIEIAPMLSVFPGLDFFFRGALGVRYYF